MSPQLYKCLTCFLCLGVFHAETVPVRIRERPSGRTIRSISQTPSPTLTVDVDLPGEQIQLNLDRNTDHHKDIPLYVLQADSAEQTINLFKFPIEEQNTTVYQDRENGAVFIIVYKRSPTGTPDVTMEGIIYKGDKLYNLRSTSLPADSIDDVTLDFDMRAHAIDLAPGAFDKSVLLPSKTQEGRLFQRPHGRHKRAVPANVNIDVVALADYAVYKLWYERSNQMTEASKNDEALTNIYRYYSFVFNGVSMMYKSITSLPYTIHVRLSSIIVARNASSSPWTEDIKGLPVNSSTATVKASKALDALATWPARSALPAHDHLMLFTGFDLLDDDESDALVGLAYAGTVCETNGTATSIVEDKDGFYQSILTAAHELGHGLSARHDGDENQCDPDANHIMAATESMPSLEANRLHPWRFSNCSVDYFDKYLTSVSETYACLVNILPTGSEVQDVTSWLPGQHLTIDQQCQLMYGARSYASRDALIVKNVSNICDFGQLNCYINRSYSDFSANTVAAGTTCGDNRWCMEGECVYNANAPAVSDNCPLGDLPVPLANGQTCADAIALLSGRCEQPYIQTQCCSSCAQVYRPITGCEYGDTHSGCLPEQCSNYNLTVLAWCCGTCNYTSPTASTTTSPTVTATAANSSTSAVHIADTSSAMPNSSETTSSFYNTSSGDITDASPTSLSTTPTSTLSTSPSPCSNFSYGTNCSTPCNCSVTRSQSCDWVTGDCTCEAGWEGITCSDDVDECRLSGSHCVGPSEQCLNTAGGYECVCVEGTARNPTGTCVVTQLVLFQVTIRVDVDFNDTDTNSSSYQELEEAVRFALKKILLNTTTGIVDIEILSLRKGSLIVKASAVIADGTTSQATSSLVTSLKKLALSNFTVSNENYPVDVTVAGNQLTSTTSSCSILRILDKCVSPNLTCDDSTGQAVCQQPSTTTSSTMMTTTTTTSSNNVEPVTKRTAVTNPYKFIIAPIVVGGVLLLAIVITVGVFINKVKADAKGLHEHDHEHESVQHDHEYATPDESRQVYHPYHGRFSGTNIFNNPRYYSSGSSSNDNRNLGMPQRGIYPRLSGRYAMPDDSHLSEPQQARTSSDQLTFGYDADPKPKSSAPIRSILKKPSFSAQAEPTEKANTAPLEAVTTL